MMDFAFTEEQELFRRTVRQFAEKELLPDYQDWDKTDDIPWHSLKRMGELGLTGLIVPEQYGGSGSDFVTQGIAVEEVARGDFNRSFYIEHAGATGYWLRRYGTQKLRDEWLPRMARGEVVFGGAITEPHTGSDVANMQTRAVRDGDEYVITGEKSSISITYSHAFVIFAKTDPSAGSRGVTAFFVPSDLPGFGSSRFLDLGERVVRRGALHLDNVRVPVENRLGEEGQGFYYIMNCFDFNRAIISLMCLGAAEQTLDETIQYVKTRVAFGKPLAHFEGISFPIAEAATLLEAARLMSYKVLWLADQGKPHAVEAAMCKWWAPRLAVDTIHQCLLLHGHAAYSNDYPIGQRMRDVIGLELGDGSAEIMKIIIARRIIGGEARPY